VNNAYSERVEQPMHEVCNTTRCIYARVHTTRESARVAMRDSARTRARDVSRDASHGGNA
jgi:hypothetical protein